MAEILPTIVQAAFYTINRDDINHNTQDQIKEFSRDSDSEPEQEVHGKIEAMDEKASAIHCLGYIFQFIPKLMFEHLDQLCSTLLTMLEYVDENVRFECISALNGISFGLNKLEYGDEFEWEVGFENPTPIGETHQTFFQNVYFPALATVFKTEDENEVIERMMQSLIEQTTELGPAIYTGRIDQIVKLINNLLEQKQANEQEDAEGDFEDMHEEDEEEDIDHNETVISNITELISCISQALGEDFIPYFEKTGELLFMRLQDQYPMRDKSLCIGTLAE